MNGCLQVSLSQVFAGMKQAQHQQAFTVLDWGVANAKLEEVCFCFFAFSVFSIKTPVCDASLWAVSLGS